MSWSAWMILGVGAIYLITSIDLFVNNKIGLALAFFGYAVANVGLFMAERAS